MTKTEHYANVSKGELIAGSFVKVSLHLEMPQAVQVPCEALTMQGQEHSTAALTQDHRVTYRKVGLRESDGKMITVSSGLEAGEKVILNPGLSLGEGARVQPFEVEENK